MALVCVVLHTGGWLLPLVFMLSVTAACPATCVLCGQDVTLCHQLTYVLAAPETTRVLILTDGQLSSVESGNLSLLVNLALLSLSRNAIQGIQDGALHGLTRLRTLALDHNHISSSALSGHAFGKLRSLQVLVLSRNALRTLRASWFRNTRALSRLLLDGNQITSLTRDSFGGTNLHRLRHLDLSNNLISYVERDAFRSLPQLQEVDLSRNRLAHMPDVFTPLKQLTLLSLEENQWRCICGLHPLASFLRNFVKSPARTLRNAKDLSCQVSPQAVLGVKSTLNLPETDCTSKDHNLTLALRDRRGLLPGQDVALMTLLGFAGTVGLTCAGLVLLNWKLQRGKANGRTSGNLCCRAFGEPLCTQESGNGHAVGHHNCNFTQQNETEVTSAVESRKETPPLQESSRPAMLASGSTAPDTSLRKLTGRGHGVDGTGSHLERTPPCAGRSGPPGNRRALHDSGLVTRHCPKRAENPTYLKLGEVPSQTLSQNGTRRIDLHSDIFRRYTTSTPALARESLQKHLPNKSWQHPIGNADNASQLFRQRSFITSSAAKLCEPGGHSAGHFFHNHRSERSDFPGLLKQSKSTDFHAPPSLICRYVSSDELQDYMKERKPGRREHSESDKEQIQINRAIEKFLRSKDTIDAWRGSSAKIEKAHCTKRVEFQGPDLVGKKWSAISPQMSAQWSQLESQSNHPASWGPHRCANPEESKEGRGRFTETWTLKKRGPRQSHQKGKVKARNLKIKLKMNPLRKIRVHPEASLPEFSKKQKQVLKPSKTVAKTSGKKIKANPLSPVSFPRQSESNSCVKFTSTKLPPEHAPEQTSHHQRKATSAPFLRANGPSEGSEGSARGSCYPAGHAPSGGSSAVSQPTAKDTECQPEQMQNATQLQVEVLGPLQAPWGNTGNGVLASQPSVGIVGSAETESTQFLGQGKLKTNEMSQFNPSTSDQTQLAGVRSNDIFYKDHTLGKAQALHQNKQSSGQEQLGSEEKTEMEKSKIPHEGAGSYVMDGEGNDVGSKSGLTGAWAPSSLTQTQSRNNLPLMEMQSPPQQSRAESPWERRPSPGSQATGLLTNSTTAAASRGRMTEMQSGEKEGKGDSSALICMTPMALKDATDERRPPWEGGRDKKQALHDTSSVQETITLKDSSSINSPETQTSLPQGETDLQINHQGHDCREIQNTQSDGETTA